MVRNNDGHAGSSAQLTNRPFCKVSGWYCREEKFLLQYHNIMRSTSVRSKWEADKTRGILEVT